MRSGTPPTSNNLITVVAQKRCHSTILHLQVLWDLLVPSNPFGSSNEPQPLDASLKMNRSLTRYPLRQWNSLLSCEH